MLEKCKYTNTAAKREETFLEAVKQEYENVVAKQEHVDKVREQVVNVDEEPSLAPPA